MEVAISLTNNLYMVKDKAVLIVQQKHYWQLAVEHLAHRSLSTKEIRSSYPVFIRTYIHRKQAVWCTHARQE